MNEVRVHHPGDEYPADVVAAQWGQDEESNRENGNRRLDADLSKGPARVRRVGHVSRPPPFLESDEVEPEKDRRGRGQPDNGEEDRAGNDVIDDLHRQDRARGQEGHETVALAKDPPAGPRPGQGEHQQQGDQEQQVGLIGKCLHPLEEGCNAGVRGEQWRGRQQQQGAERHRNRSQQVGEP